MSKKLVRYSSSVTSLVKAYKSTTVQAVPDIVRYVCTPETRRNTNMFKCVW